jgi:hypothetical protein
MSIPPSTLPRAITKTVSIHRAAAEVFAYLSDLGRWPEWAIINMQEVRPRPGDDWWDVVTPDGPALIRLRSHAGLGILDHDFRDPETSADAAATVPARVLSNGDGAEFLMTIFQPPTVTDTVFDELIQGVAIELARLKEILETERR